MTTLWRPAAIATAAIFAAAASGAFAAEPCPTQCPSGKVPLGVSLPLSGPAAAIGRPTLKAIELAVGQVNAAGGLLGTPVQVVAGDDRCDAGMAAPVATRHITESTVSFVIGPLCPAVATDAAPIYAKAGVVQLVPTVTAVELTRQNPGTLFRVAANDEQEAQALVAHLAREQKGKKLAVVYSDFFYRRAMAELVKRALTAELRASTRFEPLQDVPGANDRLAAKLQSEPADVIYLALGGEEVVEFVGKLRARGVKSLLIGGQHLLSQSFWRASKEISESIAVIAPVESTSGENIRKTVDLLKKADVIPDLVVLYNVAAVQTWAEAVRRAGSGDPKAVAAALRSGEFATAVGRVAFDQNGDRRDIGYSILRWQAGHLTAPPAAAPAANSAR
jgi:branched-chain amino acid transport system substrate-binding protein